MIVKSVILPLAPEAAFALFTDKISLWWPANRRHAGSMTSEIVLLASGRFYERAEDGHEAELGRVQSWDRPNRILLDFFIATGPDKPTEVEILFVRQAKGTEVRVTHRPTPSSEALWLARAPIYAQAWDDVLAGLSPAASRAACLS